MKFRFQLQVGNGQLPLNHQIVYQLQDILNLLPDITTESFTDTLYVKTNDQMLVVYLASMVRSIVALHNLINNKLTNSAEEGKKEEVKDKKDKDNKEIKDGKKDETKKDESKKEEKSDKGTDEKKK